jgi:membrane associated rhomboid family serine protease
MFFFLPYATERPRRRTPFVTYALVAANAAVFLLLELPYWAQGGEGLRPFAFVPANPSVGALLRSMFSHGGLWHLGGNMLFLWLFGSVAEDVLGPLPFLAFYFGGQLGATFLDVAIAKAFAPAALMIPRVGASGAIAGILGLTAVCFSRVRVKVAYLFGFFLMWRGGVARVQAWFFLGAWIAIQIAGGLYSTSAEASTGQPMGGVAYWAHIGGFAAGVIGAYVLGLPGKIRRHDLLSGLGYGAEDGSERYSGLTEVVRHAPDDAEAWLALARSKEAFGLPEQALEAYARAVNLFLERREPERAARAYEAILRLDPAFTLPPAAQFDLAVGLTRAGGYEEALAALQRLLDAYPSSPEAEVALVRAGELAERIGERAAALRYFAELLRRYPYSVWADHARWRIQELGG